MTDIPEGSGDVELALAMEVQVNARVLKVLESLLMMPTNTLTTYADDPTEARNIFLDRLQASIEWRQREQEYRYPQQMGAMSSILEIKHQQEMNQARMTQAIQATGPKKPKDSLLGTIFKRGYL